MKNLRNADFSGQSSAGSVIVDCAGAVRGGAARFLKELEEYLAKNRHDQVRLIGVGRQLSPRWLIEREAIAVTASRRISLNNAGFLNPQGENITLLRNILQFASKSDLEALRHTPTRRLRAQTPAVRLLARASETLVVPCTRMAEQVAKISPALESKLIVRFHPVSQPEWAGVRPTNPRDVLLPVVPSPYKNLSQHIPEFLKASEDLSDDPIRLIVPSHPESLPELASHSRIIFIGPQSADELDYWWQSSAAVFFPMEFESFGYPLAESRVYGRSVIAQESQQNREIAGHALHAYTRRNPRSLKEAIVEALRNIPQPERAPFDPFQYFQGLLMGFRNG